MIRTIQTLILLTVATINSTQAADFVITINGVSQEIDLAQEVNLILPDQTSLKVTLHQKEYLRFSGDLFSFEHKSNVRPSRQDLGDGIFQTIIVTPLGTGLIVQEYTQMNPINLIDLMLNEVTKEEVDYGYKYSEKTVTEKVDGITFKGKQAVTSYPGEEWIRSVLAYGKKDKGVLILTFIEKENYESEKLLIEDLWKSIKIDLKP